MDFSKITLFAMAKKHLSWLDQRNDVLAQNIANADTPGYRARDIAPLKFERVLGNEARNLQMVATHPEHHRSRSGGLGGGSEGPYATNEVRKPYEMTPSGNSVVLEEQMTKLNETGISHKLTVQLYTKHLKMLRTALGR